MGQRIRVPTAASRGWQYAGRGVGILEELDALAHELAGEVAHAGVVGPGVPEVLHELRVDGSPLTPKTAGSVDWLRNMANNSKRAPATTCRQTASCSLRGLSLLAGPLISARCSPVRDGRSTGLRREA